MDLNKEIKGLKPQAMRALEVIKGNKKVIDEVAEDGSATNSGLVILLTGPIIASILGLLFVVLGVGDLGFLGFEGFLFLAFIYFALPVGAYLSSYGIVFAAEKFAEKKLERKKLLRVICYSGISFLILVIVAILGGMGVESIGRLPILAVLFSTYTYLHDKDRIPTDKLWIPMAGAVVMIGLVNWLFYRIGYSILLSNLGV